MTSLNSLVTLQLTWSFGSTLCKRHLFLNSLLSRSSLGSFWSGAQRTFLWIRENKMTELSQWAWESSPSALNCFFLCVCVCFNFIKPLQCLTHFCATNELHICSECTSAHAHRGAGGYQHAAHRRLSLFSFYHLTFRGWRGSACVRLYRRACTACVH